MSDHTIVLPSKPKIISEDETKGVYEIDGLYPGYGHTLGNSLRRIILSSLPGAAITSVKIDGVQHEFSTIDGVKEDVISILLNLKKVRFNITSDEPQVITLKEQGAKDVVAGDIKTTGQVEVTNPDQPILSLTDKKKVDIEMTVEKGLGFISRDSLRNEKMDIGSIALDAVFTPIKKVNYEVENMRVGDRTDFNRLRITVETDGTITPKEALEKSIEIMINQLKAIVGFKEEVIEAKPEEIEKELEDEEPKEEKDEEKDAMKTRIESLSLSARTLNALASANIRTVGGLARKKEEDLLDVEGLGNKGIQEIRKALSNFGITLKSSQE